MKNVVFQALFWYVVKWGFLLLSTKKKLRVKYFCLNHCISVDDLSVGFER